MAKSGTIQKRSVVKMIRSSGGKSIRLTLSDKSIIWVTNEGDFLKTPPRGFKTKDIPLEVWWEGNRIRKRKFYRK